MFILSFKKSEEFEIYNMAAANPASASAGMGPKLLAAPVAEADALEALLEAADDADEAREEALLRALLTALLTRLTPSAVPVGWVVMVVVGGGAEVGAAPSAKAVPLTAQAAPSPWAMQ